MTNQIQNSNGETIKAIDICCGAGGWACAARGLPIEIVLAVDFWQPAITTYRLNHPRTETLLSDLRDHQVGRRIIRMAVERGVDLVLGGIPCEWLSVYRRFEKGKVDEAEREANRATLDSCLSLVKSISPQFWCLEDVIQIARELPPFTPYQIFDARNWSGQRRKRCFVGEFPQPDRDAAGGAKMLRDYIRPGPYRIGRRLMGRTPKRSRTFSRSTCLGAEMDRKAPTVLSQCGRRDAELAFLDPAVPGGMRNPEWQEMARIQGFPEHYLFYGSATDVPIPLARAILEGICRVHASNNSQLQMAGVE